MYHIIGDIHGYGNDLVKLLLHLGYTKENTQETYTHPTHKVIFLGDFIDRGINQKLVLDTVMPMVKNGSAYAVLGNHEFNAIGFHTLDAKNKNTWLRTRNDKNIAQHRAFLNDYISKPNEMSKVIDFFKSLPLWLELDGIRIVHACWHQESIDLIKYEINDAIMTPDFLMRAYQKDTAEFKAVGIILKGVELKLPNGISFLDKDKNKRTAIRADWWNQEAKYFKDYQSSKTFDISEAENHPIPDNIPKYSEDLPICFIGHYWLKDKPMHLSKNIACLDYSVAKDGKLVAYKWEGESEINNKNFIYL